MVRVLLIDDDSSLLSVMHHSLTRRAPEWQITPCLSGPRAIELIKENNFDVVLSDLQMPEVNGEQVLRFVAEHSPQTVRLLHSGAVDSARVVQAMGVAHHLFEKPCRMVDVLRVIKRAHALRLFVDSEEIRNAINAATTLPVVPTSFFELQKLLAEGDFYLPRLVRKIEQDAVVSTLLLKAANSAYFSVGSKISSVERALVRLGINTVKSIVLYSELFSQFDQESIKRFHLNELMNSSLQVGELAGRFARECTDSDEVRDQAFLGGVLHNIGKLLLIHVCPEKYEEVLNLQVTKDYSDREAEDEVLGVSYEQAGAYFAGSWGLPTSLVEAIAYHSQPKRCLVQEESPLTYVAASYHIVCGGEEISLELESYFEKIGLKKKLHEWGENH